MFEIHKYPTKFRKGLWEEIWAEFQENVIILAHGKKHDALQLYYRL